MSDRKNISVIICSYNRARSLGRTIGSVAEQSLSKAFDWEVLIVDNNSTDTTKEVVGEYQRRYPERIRYIFEPQQGISHARNSGVREARGEILAFIDDDETADPDWLQNLTANLHSGEWAGAGGPVMPSWTGPRPNWLKVDSPFTLGPLAAWTADPKRELLTAAPVGANMAYRKEVFGWFGGFRTDLGRIGKILLHGEDTEFGRRLIAAGQKLRYEPLAITHHPAEESRVHKAYFRVWWFNKGRSDVREFKNAGGRTRLFGIPVRLFRDGAVEVVRWVIAGSHSLRFICSLKIWAYAGEAYESYLQGLSAKRKDLDPAEN
jgi:glucosyl-dolichyl phosphate glucuronosyltransferase